MRKQFIFTKRMLLLAVLSFCGLSPVMGQQFYAQTEFGLQLGASTYFGDLNTNYGLHFIRPAGGAFVRYSFNSYIALKGMVNYTKIGYDDRFAQNEYQKIRNLSFRSDILEAAVVAEFNFFSFKTGDKYHRFTPFLSGGVGVFYYSPYTDYRGVRYNLRKLGTEGQNTGLYDDRKYESYSICFLLVWASNTGYAPA